MPSKGQGPRIGSQWATRPLPGWRTSTYELWRTTTDGAGTDTAWAAIWKDWWFAAVASGNPSGTGAIDASVTISGTGLRINLGQGAVAADVAISGTGLRINFGTGAVAADIAISGTGLRINKGTGAIDVAVAISGTGLRINFGTGAIDAAVAISATGQIRVPIEGQGQPVEVTVTISGYGLVPIVYPELPTLPDGSYADLLDTLRFRRGPSTVEYTKRATYRFSTRRWRH